ncbi:MAG: hypothetical protein FWC71_05840 [Defluviitaleaceae bacterium]|nr:hypothetical protein [Defluviitaleaceae bacterium]
MVNPKGLTITDFLLETPAPYIDFMSQVHDQLSHAKHKAAFQIRKYGFTAQYTSPLTKRLALQFYANDGTLYMYVYSGFIYRHTDLFHLLPPHMRDTLEASHNCTSCGSSCATKHPCTINGKQYNKCLNGRTLFTINDEVVTILPVLSEICKTLHR